ncbi:hypothetical protein GCM10010211_49390 [Streptomyces albospinus]|uniref:Cell wall-active antibiotics response LiaF-like C-terminal domain-containing protein n=1 Tax=Streptomyces albospinus TaxID=285515 RepID=A0ABQ2VBG5_9ACTN|nr:hypothetical protein GCM10010211_49390 [Streptomyces albospinus]
MVVDASDNGGRPGPETPPGTLQKQQKQEDQRVQLTKDAARPQAKPVAEADLRASDADRDRIAEILREALAEGRLDAEEHAERIDAVYRAKTLGELEPVVRDLPVAGERGRQPGPAYEAEPAGHLPDQNLVAIFSAAARKGRWRVPARINAVAVFGSVEIDLTEAVFPQQQIQINVTSFCGSVEIRVPENITLRSSGSGILGSFEVETNDAEDADAPVVHVNGFALLGSVEARPKRGAWIHDLHDRLRDQRRERHDRLDRLRAERHERMDRIRAERHELMDRRRAERRERRDRYRG